MRRSLILMRLAGVLATVLLLLDAPGGPRVPAASAAPERVRVAAAGPWLETASGSRLFVYGVNYQGPADQAWQMWRDDRFDRERIAEDFGRMRDGGYNAVRIFVQAPLNSDLAANRYQKLDYVLDQADAHGIRAILTLADYGEPRVEALVARARQLAQRYAGRGTILVWDLKNEPHLDTFATSIYPAGQPVPMLDPGLIARYGERRGRGDVAAWRLKEPAIPARFSDDQAYIWGNVLTYYREYLAEAARWVNAGSGRTSADYEATETGARWRPLLAAISDTMLIWIAPQVEAIRAVDPEALVTIGYNDIVYATRPANERLQVQSFHRFPDPGAAQWRGIFNALASLQRTFPSAPVLLEEFGYSNSTRAGAAVSEGRTASHETATWLELARRNLAGGLKWMLYDFDQGHNARENAFGALRSDGSPKAAFVASRVLAAALPWRVTSLDLTATEADLAFVARGEGLLVTAGAQRLPEAEVSIGTGGILVISRATEGRTLRLTATQPATVWLDTAALLGMGPAGLSVGTLAGDTIDSRSENGRLRLELRENLTLVVRAAIQRPTGRVEPLAGPPAEVSYFPETGHNLIYGFKHYWERHGGLAQFGYPITEEFREVNPADGKEYTVQYFERARFEYHPEHKGTPYETELGLLGRQVTAGRADEVAFQRLEGLADTPERRYFAATGHTLSGGFKHYWERHGGLAQFGYPITEEFREVNPADGKEYTVQYFERARFEYHPEHKGTPYETELGLLGWQAIRAGE